MTAGPIVTSVVPANHTTFNIANGGGGGGGGGGGASKVAREELAAELESRPPTPPWLRPPSTYKPNGKFVERTNKASKMAVAATAGKAPSAAAPAAAAVVPTNANGSSSPPPPTPKASVLSPSSLVEAKSDTEKAMDSIQRSGSSLGQLAQAASDATIGEIPRTESALEQLARTASAAKFVEDIVNGDSSIGESSSPDAKKLSQTNLQGSFEALMSMDVNSVENLLELASSGQSPALLSELVNRSDSGSAPSSGDGDASATKKLILTSSSSVNLSSRMESFIKSLSSANLLKSGLDSGAALGSLLNATSSNSLLGAAEKISRKFESSTGFTQLRVEDGLANGTHNSVDDFLSLVASGDIPHQDPNMLKVPLQKVMQSQNGTAATTITGTTSKSNIAGLKGPGKQKFSQQQLVALASRLAGGASSMNLSDMSGGGSALKKRRTK